MLPMTAAAATASRPYSSRRLAELRLNGGANRLDNA